jgi:hypothetical protein
MKEEHSKNLPKAAIRAAEAAKKKADVIAMDIKLNEQEKMIKKEYLLNGTPSERQLIVDKLSYGEEYKLMKRKALEAKVDVNPAGRENNLFNQVTVAEEIDAKNIDFWAHHDYDDGEDLHVLVQSEEKKVSDLNKWGEYIPSNGNWWYAALWFSSTKEEEEKFGAKKIDYWAHHDYDDCMFDEPVMVAA